MLQLHSFRSQGLFLFLHIIDFILESHSFEIILYQSQFLLQLLISLHLWVFRSWVVEPRNHRINHRHINSIMPRDFRNIFIRYFELPIVLIHFRLDIRRTYKIALFPIDFIIQHSQLVRHISDLGHAFMVIIHDHSIHLLFPISLRMLQMLNLPCRFSDPLVCQRYILLQLDLVIYILHLLQASRHPLVLVLGVVQHLFVILHLFRSCFYSLLARWPLR